MTSAALRRMSSCDVTFPVLLRSGDSFGGVKSSIGQLSPSTLDRPVEEALLRRLEDGLTGVLGRRDQAVNMTAFMAAVPFCPPQVTFGVPDLQRAMPPARSLTRRQLRHLLDAGSWSAEDVRVALVSCAVNAGVEAILLECQEAKRREGKSYEIVTLSFLGQDLCLPVGFLRVRGPAERRSGAMEPIESEQSAAALLLAQLCDDLEAVGLAADFAPVLALDLRYGEMPGMRADIADLGFSYALEVGPLYNRAFEGSGHPEDPLLAARPLVDQFPFAPFGNIPDPRPVPTEPEPSPSGELFVPYRRDGNPTYAIARPKIALRPGDLTGHRALNRARRLGELMAGLQPPQTAIKLRFVDFCHGPESGWQAGIMLMAILHAARQGLFPEGGL
jgi:hypothetical protein